MQHISQNFSGGFFGAMGSIPPCGMHSTGTLGSEQGVQQGDPLDPLLFPLVLHKLVRSMRQTVNVPNFCLICGTLMTVLWQGPKDAVKHAIHLIQQLGQSIICQSLLTLTCSDIDATSYICLICMFIMPIINIITLMVYEIFDPE